MNKTDLVRHVAEEAGHRDGSAPGRPFVSRPPGARRAMMQALEDDMEARGASIGVVKPREF